MADGTTTTIEEIAAGDEVWAFDPATGQEGPREVTHTITGAGHKSLVDITVTDPHGSSDVLTATDERPFWAPQQAEWVDAIDLQPGTWLRTSTGTWTQISAVDTYTAADQQVHNLTVEGLHTYYVGRGGPFLLTHNEQRGNDCVPHGFKEKADFNKFGKDLHKGLSDAGYPNAQGFLHGSAVTGEKYTNGSPFDEGRKSDIDVAIADPALIEKAKKAGVQLRGKGNRTGPLKPHDLRKLKLKGVADSLSAEVGREVRFMIYISEEAATSRSPSMDIPR